MYIGVLALDDEVEREEEILERELPPPVEFGSSRDAFEKMLKSDSHEIGSGSLLRFGSGLCCLGNRLRQPH